MAAGDFETMDVPPGIHALLAARLERLGADECAVLGRAAVMGRSSTSEPLEELAVVAVSGRVCSCFTSSCARSWCARVAPTSKTREALEFRTS